ncbi:MAG: cation diffusion facilitator family transporter [Pseudobdellovibrio sp.]
MGENHNHTHQHQHAHEVKSFGKAFAIGIILNILFVLIEGGYGFKINSLALLADAGHNLSDVAGLILAWAGMVIARKKVNAKHSYGWKKASILAAFANSIFLLVAMGSLAWEAVGRFNEPVQAEGLVIMAVAGVGIVINSVTAFLFIAGKDHDINIRGAFWHMLADALISAGVVIAGAISLKFNYSWIDPVTSLLIAVVIVFGTWRLFIQSMHLLFDGVPDSIDLEKVKEFLGSQPGVKAVFDLHIWALGTTQIALSAHLQVPEGNEDDEFLAKITDELHHKFDIDHATIQVNKKPHLNECC